MHSPVVMSHSAVPVGWQAQGEHPWAGSPKVLVMQVSHVLPVTSSGQEHWPVETAQLSVGSGQPQSDGRVDEREGGREHRREEEKE